MSRSAMGASLWAAHRVHAWMKRSRSIRSAWRATVQERSHTQGEKDAIVEKLKLLSARHPGILIVPGTIAWKKPFVRTGEQLFKKDKVTGARTTGLKTVSRAAKAQEALARSDSVLGGDPGANLTLYLPVLK